MAKLRKVLDIGTSKITKELDVIKIIKTMRTLKEYVKSIDGLGHKWKEIKQKVDVIITPSECIFLIQNINRKTI